MLHELNLTISEVAGILAFIGGLFSVWVSTKVKIAKIETTMNLKIASIETKIAEYMQANSKAIENFLTDNKQEHRELMHDVKNIRQSINGISINIAELRGGSGL